MHDDVADNLEVSADNGRPTPAAPHTPADRARRLLVAIGVIGLLAVISLGGVALVWDGDGEPGGQTFVIPEGAAATLDYPTIDTAIDVPTDLVFERGEVLTIRNEDSAANRAGPWVLAGGETLRMAFDTPGEYFYLCSVDEEESVTVTVIEASS